MKHEGDGGTNCRWCCWNDPQRISKRTGRVGNRRANGDHPNYRIFEVIQNTKKSPRDMRRLAVIKTLVKDHHLTLVGKTLMD